MKDKKNIESIILKLFQEEKQEYNVLTLDDIEKIEKDIDINSALNKINRTVAGMECSILSTIDNTKNGELLKISNLFSKIKFNRIFNYIMKARYYGYSCFEILYNEDYTVNSLIPIPHKNVKYEEINKKWIIEIANKKIDITPDKFLLCIHKWSPRKVTGESIFESCNASFLDKNLFKEQLRGLARKYGENIVVMGYDPGESEEVLLKKKEKLETDGGKHIFVPVDFLGRTGGPSLNDSIHIIKLSDLDPEIYTKLEYKEKEKLIQNILGSTLTMSVGDKGTQALGNVHMEAEEQVVEECCAFISDSLQNLLETVLPMHGINSNEFYFNIEKKEDLSGKLDINLKTEAVQTQKIDNILKIIGSGYQFSKEYISEYLGIEKKHFENATIKEFAKSRRTK